MVSIQISKLFYLFNFKDAEDIQMKRVHSQARPSFLTQQNTVSSEVRRVLYFALNTEEEEKYCINKNTCNIHTHNIT